MKIIKLTDAQIWFIRCAIESKNAVIQLHPDSLDAKTFKKDYGISRRKVNQEIENLRLKLK
jgi:hypothetical protein